MSWFRVDDHLHAHSKAVRAGTEAMGLWILAGSWSAAEESDGWVPAWMLTRLAGVGADELAERLVTAGLWERADHEDGEGFRFHQWEEHQPTRAQLQQRRADNAERMRRARSQGGKVRGQSQDSANDVRTHTEDSAEPVRSTPTRPDPSPKNTTARAAALADSDHFAAFWNTYPRKVGKTAAVKAYAKALDAVGGDALVVLDGLRNAVAVWRATDTDPRFIPHPATWLNAGRWADEVPLPDMPTGAGDRPATLAQCNRDDCPPGRHTWSDARNRYVCQGAA